MAREEERTKQQLCDDTFYHNESVENFGFICNTKETQTDVIHVNVHTQTEKRYLQQTLLYSGISKKY